MDLQRIVVLHECANFDSERFDALVNRALWHLNLDATPPDDATPWEALVRSAVELGAARRKPTGAWKLGEPSLPARL